MNKPPLFLETPDSHEVLEEERLELKCLAHGKPLPDITWYNGETEIQAAPGIDVETTYDEKNMDTYGSVLIYNARFEDEGKYTVEAKNKVSSCKQKFDVAGRTNKTSLEIDIHK